ncbi:MAG: WYL domain-containing protein [Eubacteriales bacterium]
MSRHNHTIALYEILHCYTDSNHHLSMQGLLAHMSERGLECSDETAIKYMKQLRDELGLDLVMGRGRQAKYYIEERNITKEEVTLLIDAVNASNFIEKGLTKQLNDKLKELRSCHEAKEMERNVLGVTIAKAENKKILYLVNTIQDALRQQVQIEFQYLRWNKEKQLVPTQVKKYAMNPWGLIWANERYYLYGYDVEERDGTLHERCYRVDKLQEITLTDRKRMGEELFARFDVGTYVSRRIGMFGGKEHAITIRVDEKLVGAFLDQFGKDIVIKQDINQKDANQEDTTQENREKVTIVFRAAVTNLLLGWLLGLGSVEILKPVKVQKQMKKLLEKNLEYYLGELGGCEESNSNNN